ncbi:alpha/beta hydrolase [Robiginitalea sp. SC105]|uniref:alpha/beta hydrolase n=1 Tax=Robiginitalea sp. SC105 TaxID=2762332 RepID=UPI00163970C4|nr:alpha/beta hydrolase [Robiginitalea sp. SC105]MBC2839732.1 alpha/beta hydrolase [Robiginitalea sp. SC105]
MILFLPLVANAQNKAYISKLVTTDRLTVEYIDFGGEGTHIINIQGAHNFFDESSDEPFIVETNNNWINFCQSFSDKYHVLAPLNRGFGQTDDAPENWSVKSQVEDLISFMDYLKIEKAFFFGKGPAAKNMLYLSENYPERVLGIVFVQAMMVFTDIKDSIAAEYKYYDEVKSYESSEFKKFKPSSNKEVFRPRIFSDSILKINNPTLYFFHEKYDNRTLWQGRIERFIQRVEKNPNYDWTSYSKSNEVNSYFKELASDKKRMKYIQEYFENNNPYPQMNSAIRRAYGNHLVQFNESNDNSDSWWTLIENVYIPVMKGFFYINDVKE